MIWADWLLVRRHHPLSTVSRRVGLGECWALSRCVHTLAYTSVLLRCVFDCLWHVGPQDTRFAGFFAIEESMMMM